MKFRYTGNVGQHDRQKHALRNFDMAIKLLYDNKARIERDIEKDENTQWSSIENELRVARRLILDGYKECFD